MLFKTLFDEVIILFDFGDDFVGAALFDFLR